ncbi:exosortase-dependent surface protein XDP1 [Burkholderiaceae bacterium UC74_6]
MKKTTIKSARWVALLAGLAMGASAQAASTWTFSGSGGTDPVTGEPLAKTSYASNGVAGLTIDGVYANNGTNDVGYASGAKWNSTTTPDSNVLYFSGNGLGMCSGKDVTVSCAAPNHALDNNGTTEGILMQFSSSVVLTSIGIGYVSGDADISLWRYTGASQPAALNTNGADKAAMEAAGWSLVGNYADLVQDTSNPYNLVNGATSSGSSASSVGSSWWLVTAYNSSYGTTSANGGSLGQGNDYFKIYAVAGETCTGTTSKCGIKRTPEPGSLALAGLALGGVFYTRRRKVKAS